MEYVHKIDDGENGYKGHIKLKIPNGIEKLDITKKCFLFIDQNGESKERDKFDSAKLLLESLKERITEVEVSSKDYDFKSFDELSYDDVGFKILSELSNKIVGGFRLGKSSKKK